MNNYLLALRSYILKLSSLQNSFWITRDFKAIKYVQPERCKPIPPCVQMSPAYFSVALLT